MAPDPKQEIIMLKTAIFKPVIATEVLSRSDGRKAVDWFAAKALHVLYCLKSKPLATNDAIANVNATGTMGILRIQTDV